MKLILDTNVYVGFKMNDSELVDYLSRADVIFGKRSQGTASALFPGT